MELVPVAEIVDPARVEDLLDPAEHHMFNREQARRLTDHIRTQSNRLWRLIYVANERKAWRALGYDSFKAYVAEELAITEQRAYQIIDLGKVMLTVAEELGVEPESLEPIPARAVAKVKDRLPQLRKVLHHQLANGNHADLREVIDLALTELNPKPPKPAPVEEPEVELVECPICLTEGYIGTGPQAEELATAAKKWVEGWLNRMNRRRPRMPRAS